MNVVPFRVAAQAAIDDPADIEMARKRYASQHALPLSVEVEVTLKKIQHHEESIAAHAHQIRWLRLELETQK